MSFVSYAQNFEDVMLWRALKHIEKGFYVDVGAQDPVIDSVSKAFYERGWRGIHIEPVPQYAELLRNDRPDETVLQIALSDSEGTLVLNVIPNTGLSTAVDRYAQHYQENLGLERQRVEVPVLSLRSALKSLIGKDIHWLKIDVEGFEEEVLRGWDSQALRPWIILVEATVPNSQEINYANWDPILTQAGYEFVYFDGLNRFYISKEHSELAEAFSCPPNVFDQVQLSGLSSSEFCRGVIARHHATEMELSAQIEKLAAELENLTERMGNLEGDLESEHQRAMRLDVELQVERELSKQLQARAQWLENEWNSGKVKIDELNQSSDHWWRLADQLNHELQGLYTSKSWRITWPLRKSMQAIKWMATVSMPRVRWAVRLPNRTANMLMVWTMRTTLSNLRLKSVALRVLARYPGVKHRLRLAALRVGLMQEWSADPTLIKSTHRNDLIGGNRVLAREFEIPESLSPRAAHIYSALKRAIESQDN
jgi:FkbM family methyltransferase